jgi:hypothetical protein
MEKAYDLNNMQHGDVKYTECARLIKNGISDKFLEPKNFEWVDSEGFTCSTWRIVYKEEKQKGMALEEAKSYIEQRNKEECFGYSYDELVAKQYK